MSPDETVLEIIVAALKDVKLEAILVGNVASVLQGVPVMTHDIDFFVRDTELNRKRSISLLKNSLLQYIKGTRQYQR